MARVRKRALAHLGKVKCDVLLLHASGLRQMPACKTAVRQAQAPRAPSHFCQLVRCIYYFDPDPDPDSYRTYQDYHNQDRGFQQGMAYNLFPS
jgi:hypothetical protein